MDFKAHVLQSTPERGTHKRKCWLWKDVVEIFPKTRRSAFSVHRSRENYVGLKLVYHKGVCHLACYTAAGFPLKPAHGLCEFDYR